MGMSPDEYVRIQRKLPGLLWDWVARRGGYDDLLRSLATAGLKIVEADTLCWKPFDHDRVGFAEAQRAEADKP